MGERRLTPQGCISLGAIVLVTGLVCFVIGFAFQFGALLVQQRTGQPGATAPSPSDTTATAIPTDTPAPTSTATPEPTDTPEPSATLEPTDTPEPTPTATPEPQTYTVQGGDTLLSIAQSFGVTVDAILQANPEISDPELIRPGQEIVIPQ